jgi:hypothetical protein
MSDANRVQISYIQETSWGTTPATSSPQELRWTGESLSFNISNETSKEVRTDCQISDLVQTGADASGGIEGEVSYGTYDDLIAGALRSTWSSDLDISQADDIAATATGFTSAGTLFHDIQVGQWIKVGGFTADTSINTYYKITASAPGTLTTSPAPLSSEAVAEEKTITINGAMLRNGTTETSFSIEKNYADLSPVVYEPFLGMMVNTFGMSLQANQIATVSFDFIGKDCSPATGSMTAQPMTSATTTDCMNAVANVANIMEGGIGVSSGLVQSLDFTLGNNIRGQSAIGVLGYRGTGKGTIDVNGNINVYFTNKDLLDKYVAGTESSLSFRIADTAGNAYIVTFPRIKFNSSKQNASGQNTDLMQPLGWQAIRDSTTDSTIQIDKFAA